MTASFRAHFGGNLSNVARRPAMALPGANVPDVLVRADGTWEDANGGVRISELDSGEFVPGRGGRYSVMTHEDSWNASDSDARATSPAIGWYEGDPSNNALRTEFTVDPADVRLQERIAVGGFAEVFSRNMARHCRRREAITRAHERRKRAFEQEVEVLVKLRHPNLLLFMGYCVDPPLICTANSCAEGRSTPFSKVVKCLNRRERTRSRSPSRVGCRIYTRDRRRSFTWI